MRYSPWITRDLTRLAYSEVCRELGDTAQREVATDADEGAQPASHVLEAERLLSQAREALRLAVVYERARGTTWDAIGASLGISRRAARERFGPSIRTTLDGIVLPHRSSEGEAGFWACPEGLEDADRTLRSLDDWAARHRAPTEPERARAPVSAGLCSQNPSKPVAEVAELRALDSIGIVMSLAQRLTHRELPHGVDERYARRVLLEHQSRVFSAIAEEATAGSERDAITKYDEAPAEPTTLHEADLRDRLTAERRNDDEILLQLDGRPVAVLARNYPRGWFVSLATPPPRGGEPERAGDVDLATEAAIAAGLSNLGEHIASDELATPPIHGGEPERVGDLDAAAEAATSAALNYISDRIASDLANGIGPFRGGIAGAGETPAPNDTAS